MIDKIGPGLTASYSRLGKRSFALPPDGSQPPVKETITIAAYYIHLQKRCPAEGFLRLLIAGTSTAIQ